MTQTLNQLTRALTVLDAKLDAGTITRDERAERAELIVAIHDEERLIAAHDRARAQAMDDPTGQALDALHDEEG